MGFAFMQRYHTLDALRFFAFIKVFLLHVPATHEASFFNFIKQGGGTGVALFFVLSGFLISDRLFNIRITNKFSATQFFFRRALRIWPLYFLGVLLAFVGIKISDVMGITSSDGYDPQWVYTLFFLENYRMIWEGTHPRGVPLQVFWSLCIEEHFYILWILIFKFSSLNSLFATFVKLTGIAIILRVFVHYMFPEYAVAGAEFFTSMDYFTMGALIAWFKVKFPQTLVPAKLQLWVVIMAGLFMLFQHTFYTYMGVWGITFTALVYSVLIAVLVLPGKGQLKIAHSHFLSYLGSISYGLYVFHTPVLLVVINIMNRFSIQTQTFLGVALVASASLLVTIIISAISYRYFELPFLRIRAKLFGSTP